MSGFAFCGNCRGLSREEEANATERFRQPWQPTGAEESPFWRPLAWCPDEHESPSRARGRGPRDRLGSVPGFEEASLKKASLDIEGVHQISRHKLDNAASRIQTQFRRTRIRNRISVLDGSYSVPGASEPKTPEGGASSSSRARGRAVSFADAERESCGSTPPSGAVAKGAKPPQAETEQPQAAQEPATPKTCSKGHALQQPTRQRHGSQRRCEKCNRSFLPEAKMWSCKRCNYFLCEGCAVGQACCGNEFKPGARVQLCGMNSPLLNCMNGYVQGRADQNRYTVLISELGDTITLPAKNLAERGCSSQNDSGSETSGSEVYDINAPMSRRKGRKRTFTQRIIRTLRKSTLVKRISRFTKHAADDGVKGGAEETAEKSMPDSSVPLLEAWWEEKKRLAKEQLLEVSAPMRKRMLENIGEFVKGAAMRDPDMWYWVRPVVKSAVGGIWDDIEVEIENNVEAALTDERTHHDLHAAAQATPGPEFQSRLLRRSGAWYLKFRAWFLYHYLPYNKTFFGKMKDPIFDVMVAFTMLPLFGVRFFFFSALLFMLLIPGPADEYQLVNFILHFKGTMFFTSGVIMLFIGAMQYNRCYLLYSEDIRGCIQSAGPGATEWLCTLVVDYLGSISLVWIAWLVLPCSRKFPSHVERMRGWSRREEERSSYCCCLEGVITRGGRLAGLLSYDVICFWLSLTIMASIYWATDDPADWDWSAESISTLWARAKAVTYWCQVLYALFSLPFALFVVPVFSWLLTHSTFTGYNQHGALVEFAFPVVQQELDGVHNP